jgi:ring-1,2-phenylacetyl-CoA epoxidase subunit PaaD
MDGDALKPGDALKQALMRHLEGVADPEIPVLNIVEMGIVRGIDLAVEEVVVHITPTYMGCPAMDFIAEDVVRALKAGPDIGSRAVRVELVYSPAWTTDWLSNDAKARLETYGIAPPERGSKGPQRCPQCKSSSTELISLFGSTACKSQHRCLDCREPFEHFKCI